MRTTLDIDAPILHDLKAMQKEQGKSLGRLVSDLLVVAIHERTETKRHVLPLKWISKPMDARVDLADREALYDAMGEGRP